MTNRRSTVQSNPKPCTWRPQFSIFRGQAVSGIPPRKRRHAPSPEQGARLPLLSTSTPVAPAKSQRGLSPRARRQVFDDPPRTRGDNPSTSRGSHDHGWGICLTLGVGNMLTLDTVATARAYAVQKKIGTKEGSKRFSTKADLKKFVSSVPSMKKSAKPKRTKPRVVRPKIALLARSRYSFSRQERRVP